jgi:DNA-binding HxlR family transcriptional regulator
MADAPPLTIGVDSIFRTADAVGDAWSWLVLREALLYRVDRFDDFQSRLGIARSTLSSRLAQLTNAGLLERHGGGDYQPTESGSDFVGCLMVAKRWGDRWYFPPDAPPQAAIHIGCGRPLAAVLRCATCRGVLAAHDVTAVRANTVAQPRERTLGYAGGRKRRSPDLELLERHQTCSIARTLTVTGDWWSGLIIRECFFGTRRFDHFQRRLEIAPNILSGRLRRLVELDMLTKVQYETWPVRHEYRLTEKGLDYYHVPLAMLTWGRRWLAPDADARLKHTPCGGALHASLACASCGETIARDDIALTEA